MQFFFNINMSSIRAVYGLKGNDSYRTNLIKIIVKLRILIKISSKYSK